MSYANRSEPRARIMAALADEQVALRRAQEAQRPTGRTSRNEHYRDDDREAARQAKKAVDEHQAAVDELLARLAVKDRGLDNGDEP